jgi:hypothetical protein
VNVMTQILKRINPVKQTIKGKMYLSIKAWCFHVTMMFFIVSFVFSTINNWVMDYLLLIYNLWPSGRFGPYYIQIKLQKCMPWYNIQSVKNMLDSICKLKTFEDI